MLDMTFLGTKRIAKRLLGLEPQQYPRNLLPKKVWGTKGFEFWTFLSLLLQSSRCKRLLELGSGRSTVTLAEYAQHTRAQFVSIETSPEWLQKWHLEFRFLRLHLTRDPVHLVTLNPETGWYELGQFRAATEKAEP